MLPRSREGACVVSRGPKIRPVDPSQFEATPERGPRMTPEQRQEARAAFARFLKASSEGSPKALAEKYGVSVNTIYSQLRGVE